VFILKKIVFSRTSKPISIKLGTNYPWVKGILNCSIRSRSSSKGRLLQKCKNGVGSFKNLLNHHRARIGHIYMKASDIM
jgi:hypothetical protein